MLLDLLLIFILVDGKSEWRADEADFTDCLTESSNCTSLPSLSVPPALLPHDTPKEEGAGPRGGLQQGGVT